MSKLRRYERDGQDVQRGRIYEGPMRRVDTLASVDRQVEHARRYYPSGQVEAERTRVREREIHAPYTLPRDEGGCLLRWLKGMIGLGYVCLVLAVGWWLLDGWVGGLLAMALLAAQGAAHEW